MTQRKPIIIGIVIGSLALIIILGLGLGLGLKHKSIPSLEKGIAVQDIMQHLNSLQSIATNNGGNRALGSTGYSASVAYIVSQLKEFTDYKVTLQPFNVTRSVLVETSRLSQFSPQAVNYSSPQDFLDMGSFVGERNLTRLTQPATLFGCTPADFPGFINGSIALISRGNCTFLEKVNAAVSVGASAVLIYNQGENQGPFLGSFGGVMIPVPAFSMSFILGSTLAEVQNLHLQLFSHSAITITQTTNVIAQTLKGRADQVIVSGSHLDSVPAGPGINDNGSGSSTNLELAIQMYKLGVSNDLQNQVRFAWFAAEEIGLVGSTYYVNSLNQTNDIKNIALNLNLDMVGSPNYFRGIYDGSGASANIRKASQVIQGLYQQQFNASNLASELTPFSGRSDYGPFIAAGIPAGGLFTGAEVIKTMTQRLMYGGLANAAYDPCYHQACDTVDNINQVALLQMAQAAAFTLETLAIQKDLQAYLQGN